MEMHHAWLMYADSLEESSLDDAYKKQSADVMHFVRDRLSIDDARELTALSIQSSFEAPQRVFVIEAKDVAVEAQNALLKLFEEPPAHAHFYLILPPAVSLLPTLRSRLSLASVTSAETLSAYANDAFFRDFKSATFSERLLLIAEKTKNKDTAWIETIMRGCEVEATKRARTDALLLREVIFARKYIKSKGASAKMLLENMALHLPVK